MSNNELDALQKIIGYRFNNIDLLKRALTHKSYAAETGIGEFNERMEFLGDSILSAITADYLYHRYPEEDEGKLSQIKSQMVSQPSLSKWAKEIKLGNFFYISRGEDLNGGRTRDSLLSNTLEALIAAIYLDSGYAAAKRFIMCYLVKKKRILINDPKSKLQEFIQSKYQTLPEYKVMKESGPDHEKIFEVGVYLKKNLIEQGSGRSKKEAEVAAARKALKVLDRKKI